MKIKYTKQNIYTAIIVYGIGDSIATLIVNNFLWTRLLGVIIIGATIYALEIPNYFNWIETKIKNKTPKKRAFQKTLLALIYFNPLWIFRHLVFLKWISNDFNFSYKGLFIISIFSFFVNIPISIFGNFIIQNKISLKRRFLASGIFSALMAIYYALSETLFS